MDPVSVEIVGILFAVLAAFLIGERIADHRWLRDERAVRAVFETRYDILISNGNSERDLWRLAAEAERKIFWAEIERLHLKYQMLHDEAANERAGLINRLQAWTPAAPAEVEPGLPGSHKQEMQDEDLSEAQLDALEAEGFSPTLDGQGFVDTRSGAVWESLDEARKWRKKCQADGLPETTDPRVHLGRKS